MKMLFSSASGSEIKLAKKKLFDAGIRCQLRNNPLAHGIFGIPPAPELWIEKDSDILKALKVIGGSRLQQMTVIFPA
jgi:hypothetical protein